MHVVHVYKDYPPVMGGIENHVRMLAEGQARRGLRVTVLVTARDYRPSVERENGVAIIRVARLGEIASTPLSWQLIRRLRGLEADVIHLQFPYPMGEVAALLSRKPRGLVISYQSDIVRQRWLGRLYRPLMHRVLARADRILTSSEAYLWSSKVVSRYAAKTKVVPLGVDLERFAKPSLASVKALRYRWPGPLMLFVGRLRYYKGLEYLLEAMARLDATLLIVGRGPMEAQWKRLAAKSEAAQRIRFVGDVSDRELPNYYAAADVFVLPSSQRSEAFGLVQAEAMASGTPVVTTDLGTGTSFVNRHGETGWVVPAADPISLAKAIERLLKDDNLRHDMGAKAQARARAIFDAEKMVDRVIEVYGEVLAAPGKASLGLSDQSQGRGLREDHPA
ncbi:MAG: glycosyltransferase [Acidobacteriota bacterium]